VCFRTKGFAAAYEFEQEAQIITPAAAAAVRA
jgi:hypothetical protein